MRWTAAAWIGLAATVVATSFYGGCGPLEGERPAPIVVAPRLNAEYVAVGIEPPAAMAFLPDGRVLFTEKNTGLIRIIVDGTLQAAPFAKVAANTAGDRGLHGIAVHPDFSRNRRVYVFYTRSDTGETTSDPRAIIDHRIVYFEAGGDVADGGEIFVTSIPASASTSRVGGRIGFGHDGTLLVCTGDFGNRSNAQSDDSLGGKVLRYRDDGTIPADNPRAGSPIYARGLRDPRGLAFEPVTRATFVVDRNDGGAEEVNQVEPGRNFGWPSVIGVANTSAELAFVAETSDYADPVYESGSSMPGLVGGGFNPGARYGQRVQHDFFYGESATRRVIHAVLTADRGAFSARAVFADGFPSPIVDVAFTPAGTLYVACETAILRLAPVD